MDWNVSCCRVSEDVSVVFSGEVEVVAVDAVVVDGNSSVLNERLWCMLAQSLFPSR